MTVAPYSTAVKISLAESPRIAPRSISLIRKRRNGRGAKSTVCRLSDITGKRSIPHMKMRLTRILKGAVADEKTGMALINPATLASTTRNDWN